MFLRSGKHVDSESPIAKKKKEKICKSEMSTTLRIFDQLPQDCLAQVISRTTPCDACVSSAVSHTFRSVANLEVIWQCFLPSDYASFLSHAVEPVEYASKKELYFQLCDHPVPIYGGKMAFGLEKSSGAKCFTISARGMIISFIDCKKYWQRVPISNSRFPEAAQLLCNQWRSALTFSGRISSTMLSSDTTYTAYLIYRSGESALGITGASLLESTIEIGTVKAPNGIVCLNRKGSIGRKLMQNLRSSYQDIEWPKNRRDGWKEIKIGEFYIKSGEDEKVKSTLQKTEGTPIPGILILGIEIKPKKCQLNDP